MMACIDCQCHPSNVSQSFTKNVLSHGSLIALTLQVENQNQDSGATDLATYQHPYQRLTAVLKHEFEMYGSVTRHFMDEREQL